jgi:hypothetical protein
MSCVFSAKKPLCSTHPFDDESGTVLEDVAPHQLILLQLLRRGVSGENADGPKKMGGQRLIMIDNK